MLRKFNNTKPPSNKAQATLAAYAYSSVILAMATVYFLAMAIPICLVLVFLLERKTTVTHAHYLASANTKHRWPDELEWSNAQNKIILRTKKKAKYKVPETHLMLCPEKWGLFTSVINLDRANWFVLGLGAQYVASLLHQMIVLQCMTGWSIVLAKATYNFVLRRPKKPPKTVSDPVQSVSDEADMASSSDDDSCAPVSPTRTNFHVHGRLSFAFNPNQRQSLPRKSLCCIACSTGTLETDDGCEEMFKANFGEAEEFQFVGLDNMCSRHLFSNKSDFIGKILPIDPLEICGVAGGFTAKGEGTVRVRFHNDAGVLVDKKIYKALYAPESMVRLISITQLARQAPANEITKATTSRDATE